MTTLQHKPYLVKTVHVREGVNNPENHQTWFMNDPIESRAKKTDHLCDHENQPKLVSN